MGVGLYPDPSPAPLSPQASKAIWPENLLEGLPSLRNPGHYGLRGIIETKKGRCGPMG